MIECYYKWCKHHDKDEPFCCYQDENNMPKCVATEWQITQFAKLREKELNKGAKA